MDRIQKPVDAHISVGIGHIWLPVLRLIPAEVGIYPCEYTMPHMRVHVAQNIKEASSSVWNKHCIWLLTISLYFETVTNFSFALFVYVCWGVCVCFIGWRFT